MTNKTFTKRKEIKFNLAFSPVTRIHNTINQRLRMKQLIHMYAAISYIQMEPNNRKNKITIF